MTNVRCLICLNKAISQALMESNNSDVDKELDRVSQEVEAKEPFNIRSSIISKNNQEEMGYLGKEMVSHLQTHHPKELEKVAVLQIHWNGFNVMKFFEAQDKEGIFETEKENMRDQLCEEVMMFAPEDEEDDFEDEDDDLMEHDEGDLPEDKEVGELVQALPFQKHVDHTRHEPK